MKSPLERRQARIGEAGRRAERHTAKRLGARLTPGSGSGNLKGDFYTEVMHVEAKSTQNQSISLKLDWLKKITKIGRARAKSPAVTITFTTADGRPKPNGTWVLIPEGLFNELIQRKIIG